MLSSDCHLSIVLITKDADGVVRGALESVKRVGEEIIIVDSGSTDKTIEVVQKFTKKVYKHPFENDFSKLRNFGLEKALGNWILVLDADERLTPAIRQAISKLIKNDTVEGYWFRRKTYVNPQKYLAHGLFYPDYQLRLFRNKKTYRYRGTVHEELTIPKEKTQEIAYDIFHFPQHPKYDSFASFRNLMPYVEIQAKELISKKMNWVDLLISGVKQFILLFFGGFIRGKGYLDGYLGFRAHFMFAASIMLAYFWAGWEKLRSSYAVRHL